MPQFTIPRPKKLSAEKFYDKEMDAFCASGYLIHHILGVPKEDLFWGSETCRSWSANAELQDKLPMLKEYEDNAPENIRESMVTANNKAKTQEERIASFERYCKLLDIALED